MAAEVSEPDDFPVPLCKETRQQSGTRTREGSSQLDSLMFGMSWRLKGGVMHGGGKEFLGEVQGADHHGGGS